MDGHKTESQVAESTTSKKRIRKSQGVFALSVIVLHANRERERERDTDPFTIKKKKYVGSSGTTGASSVQLARTSSYLEGSQTEQVHGASYSHLTRHPHAHDAAARPERCG